MDFNFLYIKDAVLSALNKLKDNEQSIIANDVSERAITHKLAEYLQLEFKNFHVDCEYNRNFENGPKAPKNIKVLNDNLSTHIRKKEPAAEHREQFYKEVSTYPDIIVHKRKTNEKNLLIIEVKKDTNNSNWAMDEIKLNEFTKPKECNGYGFEFGLHITIFISETWKTPELIWYSEGDRI